MATSLDLFSLNSQSTRGGCSFENLCNGSCSSYACDNVIDVTKDITGGDIRKAEKLLYKHIKQCIQCIETERGSPIEFFYIGKTFVKRRKNVSFNHMDKNTWKLDDGINGRHREHKDTHYGCDGLVVLTVITRACIPDNCSIKFDQQDMALALESRLIQDFMTDQRLSNETLEPGRKTKDNLTGYPLYMAFKVGFSP